MQKKTQTHKLIWRRRRRRRRRRRMREGNDLRLITIIRWKKGKGRQTCIGEVYAKIL